MWTTPVAAAWKDVMSFAMLVVVERTVESWGSTHGTSLSDVSMAAIDVFWLDDAQRYWVCGEARIGACWRWLLFTVVWHRGGAFGIVLCRAVLCVLCVVSCRTILFVVFCVVLCRVVSCRVVSCRIVCRVLCVVSCRVLSYRVLLFSVVSCCVVLVRRATSFMLFG